MDSVRDEGPGDAPVSVFVSYSREDRPKALPLIAAFEAAGLSVWWDGLLAGGDAFAHTTEAALETADAVVVLWSARSIESHWVRDEATSGRDRGRMVPVSLDGTQPPLGFRQIQYIDLSRWRGKASAGEFRELLAAIRATANAPRRQLTFVQAGHSRTSRRRAIAFGAGGVALLGAGAAAWKFGLLSRASVANSVAVLPFRNLSGDAAQAYFSDGLTEQIRQTLTRNAKLRVLAQTSTGEAMRGEADPRAVARKLGAAYVLDGSVRRSGETLRIAARLTDAANGTAAWSDQMDRPMADVFAVQEDIAGAVAEALAAQTAELGQSDRRRTGGTGSTRAYDAYLRGRAYHALRSGESSMRAALGQYDAALAADPDFADALSARAEIIVNLTQNYAKADAFKAAYDDALSSARRAAELAPRSANAQAVLGYVLVQGKLDVRGAKQPFARARELGAGDSKVMSMVAIYAAELGQAEAAEVAVARAIDLDPLNAGAYRIAAFVAYSARHYPLALERCAKALSVNPRLASIRAYRGDNLLQLGRLSEARAAYLEESTELLRETGLTIVEHRLGGQAAAQQAFDRLTASMGDGATYQYAQIYAQWGRLDEAMEKLGFAREIGDVGLALARTDPLLDPLRGRPEFSRLLGELGFG